MGNKILQGNLLVNTLSLIDNSSDDISININHERIHLANSASDDSIILTTEHIELVDNASTFLYLKPSGITHGIDGDDVYELAFPNVDGTLLAIDTDSNLVLSDGGTIVTGTSNDITTGNSIVLGYDNVINGDVNGAIGQGLKLMDGYCQFVCGKYNVANKDAMFIVADGDDDANRKNLFQVTVDGDAIVENTVYCSDVQCDTINGTIPCTYTWDSDTGTLIIL